jgi:hypothetical protein
MSLHGQEGQFQTLFPGNGIGGARDTLMMLEPVCNGKVGVPPV